MNVKTKLAAFAMAGAIVAAPVFAQNDVPALPGQVDVSRVAAGSCRFYDEISPF